MDSLFSSRSFAFRQGEQPDRVPERTNGDELRTKIHSLQNVMPRKILVVEEDPYYIEVIKEALTEGSITIAATWQNALRHLTHELYDLVIISLKHQRDLDTIDLMQFLRSNGDELNFLTPYIATIGEGYESRAKEAVQWGCLSAIQKPFTAAMVRGMIVDQFNNSPRLFNGRNS
jgi:DNA-binding NtrC family response regulator